jgi:hypothetical protein
MASGDDSKPFCWDCSRDIEGAFTTCTVCGKPICDDCDLRKSEDEKQLCSRCRHLRVSDRSHSFRPGKPRKCNRKGCPDYVFLSNRIDGVWRPYESWAYGQVPKGVWQVHACKSSPNPLSKTQGFSPEALEIVAADLEMETEGDFTPNETFDEESESWTDLPADIDPAVAKAEQLENEIMSLRVRLTESRSLVIRLRKERDAIPRFVRTLFRWLRGHPAE